MEPVCVLDLATLTHRWDSGAQVMTTVAATGELLARVSFDGPVETREAAAVACDTALSRARVIRSVVDPDGIIHEIVCRVALYNPHTGRVAVGPLPGTVVFWDGKPLALPADGSIMQLTGDRDTLTGGDRTLTPETPSMAAVPRLLAAHGA